MLLAAPELDRGSRWLVPGDMRHAQGNRAVRVDRDLRDSRASRDDARETPRSAWRPGAGCRPVRSRDRSGSRRASPGGRFRRHAAARRTRRRPPARRSRRRRCGSRSRLRELRLVHVADLDLDGEHLALDPLGVRRGGRRTRAGSTTVIRSVSSSPASLRIEFSWWIRSSTRPSSSSSASIAVSSATVSPSSSATAQPSSPSRSTSTSSGSSSCPPRGSDRRRAPRSRRPGAPPAPRRAPSRASARAAGRFGFTRSPAPRPRRTRPP